VSQSQASNLTPIERAQRVRLLVCDVDGVLTDGRIIYGSDGFEAKAFHTLDGLGMQALKGAGIAVQWLTARSSDIVTRRAEELGISVLQGIRDKASGLASICQNKGIALEATAYIGDDWLDLPALTRVGFACTVPNASPAVKARAHWVSAAHGGHGAVRELAEFILASQNKLDAALAPYLL
jgi:3-deoxy-D-manno-octulosonate 8-phosphate phosphatase (KDO 8-P phosphatase)